MTTNLILFLTALSISLAIGNPLINFLKSTSLKQTIREEGPPSHKLKKSQIPTIGGIIFLIPIFVITTILFFSKNEFQTLDLIVILGTTLVMASLGFIDDYLKVVKKHNKGISGWLKLFIQFLVSFAIYYLYKEDAPLTYLIWVFFIIAGASNSYNLTDGLDGLAVSISLVSLLGFSFLCLQTGKSELVTFLIIFIGSLFGFLYFNKYPAKVFMGDTGSLAIGGAIGATALVSRHELYLALFATIPILETLSVILQVASCQLSKRFLGKDTRIFKMTPLHHHFELTGWKETDVVKRFFLFQFVCVLLGIVLILV